MQFSIIELSVRIMDKMTFYTALSAWAACTALVTTAAFVFFQLRTTHRLAYLQIFLQLASQYDSADTRQIRSRLAHCLLKDPECIEIEDSLLVFFENLAILYRRGILDRDLVWNTFVFDVPRYWHAVGHFVTHLRTTHSDPSIFEEFEKFACSLERDMRSPIGTTVPFRTITQMECRRFLESELRRGQGTMSVVSS